MKDDEKDDGFDFDKPKPYTPVYPDGLPGHTDQDTSLEAAMTVLPRAGELQLEVLRAVASLGVASATDVKRLTGIYEYSLRPRLTELKSDKLRMIEDSGERGTSDRGSPEKKYRLTELGRAYLKRIA